MPYFRYLTIVLIAFAWTALAGKALAENWPQWRGPLGVSVSREPNAPLIWRERFGLTWKSDLPAWGASTPVVWNDAVFVTSHTDDDRLLLLRFDRRTGQVVWTREVGQGEAVREAPKRSRQKFHRLHNLASPSPTTDGAHVVVHFGNGDLAVYDFAGNQRWKRNLQEEYGNYSIWWGHANSPVLFGNAVISVCMQDSLADLQNDAVESYLVAHDAATGKLLWKKTRTTAAESEQCDSYTTPLLLNIEGQNQLVVMGGNQLDAYEPRQGRQLWRLPGLRGGRTITGPTFAHGMIYTTQGMRGPLVAVKTGGEGELTSRSIVWKAEQGTPDSCSPVVWEQWLFTVTDDGVARCYNALGGQLQWKKRLPGKYKASPLAAAGRIYFLNTAGLCTVISATAKYEKLAANQLDDETLASPIISGGKLFIRGKSHLYCIGDSNR